MLSSIDFHFIYFHFMILVKFTLPYSKGIKYRYIIMGRMDISDKNTIMQQYKPTIVIYFIVTHIISHNI